MAADRNNDDIAAALHGLSAGGAEPAASPPQPTPPPPKPTARPSTRPAAPGVPTPPPVRSAPPPVTPPGSGKRPPAPVARPATPAAPPARPAPPPAPRARPASPARPAAPGEPSHADVGALGGDVPPAAGGSLAYQTPVARAPKPPFFKSLGFRRTMIPVLLTTGVMLIVLAVARWTADEETALAQVPSWSGALLVGLAALLIVLGVLNMLLVRQQTRASAAAAGPR